MNSLKMHIRNMKCINELSIELPLDKGLYAITGLNGSGKSTIAASASSAFFNPPMKEYFGETSDGASIVLEYNGKTIQRYKNQKKQWERDPQRGFLIKGFYEGSIMYGNRFKDASFGKIVAHDHKISPQLKSANEFIRVNLGLILQGSANYYEKLFILENDVNFKGDIFYYEKHGVKISQFHMSTGENMLLSILNFIAQRIDCRTNINEPCLILLDEIELALHPLSLSRLLVFLQEIAETFNFAIYFSTHSLELIGCIPPENIFFIQRLPDGQSNVINPCGPAYATRTLYTRDGYDFIILVEDDLAKYILERILTAINLRADKFIFISPIGGWSNVLDYANDAILYKLFGKKTEVICILDGDVRDEAQNYLANKKYAIPVNYLPLDSLEKYLYQNLVSKVDVMLFNNLNSKIFTQTSLERLLIDYRNKYNVDNDGKHLWNVLAAALEKSQSTKEKLIEEIWIYLQEKCPERIKEITNFLKTKVGFETY